MASGGYVADAMRVAACDGILATFTSRPALDFGDSRGCVTCFNATTVACHAHGATVRVASSLMMPREALAKV